MSYVVKAPLVLARDKGGHVHHVYEGGVIDWLPEDQAKHFVDTGLVEKSGGAEDSEDEGQPAKSAPKSEWVDFAVAAGYDREEVEAMNKADIQALDFG
ncbi:Gp7 [uncultured Mycobacterium sp.]|uniref:Gp7 n=1 Tax=uncultured Mycobacterium sp. TaxID=171292 RepID=A0A1Y5P539_9MYCO|nr:Gp7 [uncultured Mycobacterium sp.]